MSLKVLLLTACLVAAASAQYFGTPSVSAVSQNTYRGFGNFGQVSTYSKALDTPFSSVRKSDVRITNPGYATTYAAAPYPYAAPLAHAPVVAAPYAY